ncbi:GNAT family N-acetyltransferase [Halobacterium jilantaiense]|uniref:Acetyltransferase (GNAT) family protein n=1 Tax=Halobacterium jilantaiense TaxID=355548 RepID=A0A1I0PHL4_9EURY|nr:GNAT family N-acetyltransferase [Halobacterium jilantaiense]SEW13741.1 Acetyltransferase (GNAT) family protein [Halobacterium jilantaiense]
MAGERVYPDEVAGAFPEPPVSFTDGEGRDLEVRGFETVDEETAAVDALVAMYDDFDPSDRAQGVPPVGEDRVRDWLDTLLEQDGFDVVAWHGDEVAGHATLVPDDGETYELAIFVHQTYQGAGIGTRLIEALLGHAQANGAELVWLSVERWNRPAVALYEKVGFETASAESFEMEMAIRLN